MNERNGEYVLRNNPRRLYPLVDDKLATKRLVLEAGIPAPALYGVISTYHDTRKLEAIVADHGDFVIKPAHGSGGDGILVVAGRGRHAKAGTYRLIDGSLMDQADIRHHLSNVLSGQYSLAGLRDEALIEYCVRFDTTFIEHAYSGIPDIRVIVYRGYPAMAMVRLPTRRSHGKANLHQGAVGAGIGLADGRTTQGVMNNRIIDEHPDTGAPIAGLVIPEWSALLEMAARCHDLTGLGYLGVDIVLDRELGPLLLELNARPGLSIQLANGAGLRTRLGLIDGETAPRTPAERVAFCQHRFGAAGDASP